MLSRVIAKNIGNVFLRHSVDDIQSALQTRSTLNRRTAAVAYVHPVTSAVGDVHKGSKTRNV